MKLVENARQAWKWFSMQAMALATALQIAWLNMPPDLKDSLPAKALPILTIVLLIAGGIGRMVKQGGDDV